MGMQAYCRAVLVQREMESGRRSVSERSAAETPTGYEKNIEHMRCQVPQQAAVPAASRRCIPAACGCKPKAPRFSFRIARLIHAGIREGAGPSDTRSPDSKACWAPGPRVIHFSIPNGFDCK